MARFNALAHRPGGAFDNDGLTHTGEPRVKKPVIPQHIRRQDVRYDDPQDTLKHGPDATLHVDTWTRLVAHEEVECEGTFAETLVRQPSAAWVPFVREVFAELYDNSLRPLDDDDRGKVGEWVAEVRAKAHELPEWEGLAMRCLADGLRAGLAAHTVCSAIGDVLPPPEGDDPDMLQDLADELTDVAEANPTAANLENAQQAAQQAADAAALWSEAAQHVRNSAADVRQALRRAVRSATEAIDTLNAQSQMFGYGAGVGRGSGMQVAGPERALLDAMRSSVQLRRLVELAGRMRTHARDVRKTRTRAIPEELVGVEMGGDWQRLVGAELLGLADEDLELHLIRKVMERGAMQYALEGNEDAARGPIVFCLDESGSMEGDRDTFAKAAAFAMAEIATREKRPFSLVHFSDGVARTDHYRPPRPMPVEQLLGMLTYFDGGGTDIDKALQHAAGIVEAEGAMAKADVVLVSDGGASFPKRALARLEACKARVHGLAVASSFGDDLIAACETYAELSTAPTEAELDALNGIFSV